MDKNSLEVPGSSTEISLTRAERAVGEGLVAEQAVLDKRLQKLTSFTRQDLEQVAVRYSQHNGEALTAIVAGGIGGAGGLALGVFGGASIVLTGPVGMVVAAALGVLAFRGRAGLRHERASKNLKAALVNIDDAIASLPESVRDSELPTYLAWRKKVLAAYVAVAMEAMDSGEPEAMIDVTPAADP